VRAPTGVSPPTETPAISTPAGTFVEEPANARPSRPTTSAIPATATAVRCHSSRLALRLRACVDGALLANRGSLAGEAAAQALPNCPRAQRLLWRIFATTRVRPCSFLATILNFSLPAWTPLIRTSSHLAPRFFVTRSLSDRSGKKASVRVPEVSVNPVASKELPLSGQVSATCTVSAVGEMVTVSGSAVPAVVKLSATVVAGAAGGPATGPGGGGGGSGSGGAGTTVVVQVP